LTRELYNLRAVVEVEYRWDAMNPFLPVYTVLGFLFNYARLPRVTFT